MRKTEIIKKLKRLGEVGFGLSYRNRQVCLDAADLLRTKKKRRKFVAKKPSCCKESDCPCGATGTDVMAEIELKQGWTASPQWIAPSGFMAVLKIANKAKGLTFERTRFDMGKLLFLDRPEGFPDFDERAKVALANRLSLILSSV